MEQLISLLFSNPLYLVIAIFGLVSLLGRMAKGGQQTNQRQNQQGQHQPTSAKEEPGKIDWRDIFNQEEVKTEPTRVEPKEQNQETYAPSQHREPDARDEMYQRLEEMKKKKQEAQQKASKQLSVSAANQDLTRSSELDLNFKNISSKEAMKAVVWAEVLGKPRSRNPHQSFAPPRQK
ncbi:hypothetical protein [Alkalicoccobacillus plakortidis]|uniref:Uncharacterized protein n=1 Tax=Alkalicoccobacillus plakortidis TaxID=444060 RepID=A0ABT0XPL7_9BACI|nr:hypothetical protein [Alkalicoccobacillus plakortidis]MCM2677854.1 hypothetical protein [Alkalicoccobacillus plakortidis]